MNVRHVLYVAALVVGCLWAGTVWSAPAKATPAKAYVVGAHDSGWWALAHAHRVSMQQLLAANHATPATPLRAGQTIQMPVAPANAKVQPPAASAKHAAVAKAAPSKSAPAKPAAKAGAGAKATK